MCVHSSLFVVFGCGLLHVHYIAYPSSLLSWHWGNHMNVPVTVKQHFLWLFLYDIMNFVFQTNNMGEIYSKNLYSLMVLTSGHCTWGKPIWCVCTPHTQLSNSRAVGPMHHLCRLREHRSQHCSWAHPYPRRTSWHGNAFQITGPLWGETDD